MGWFHDDVFYFFGVEMIYNFLSLNFLLEMSLNNQFVHPFERNVHIQIMLRARHIF
jgi:hypothetical protein